VLKCMLQTYVSSVSHVSEVCCKCFIRTVDRNVAYVAMVVYVCYKLLFPMLHPFFPDIYCKCIYLDITYGLHICCKCFIWMLHIFYNGFQVFLQMFRFMCIQTYVTGVTYGCFKSKSGVASPSSLSTTIPRCLLLLPAPAGIRRPLPLFSMLVMSRDSADLRGHAKRR
jgi:hypothetical protein